MQYSDGSTQQVKRKEYLCENVAKPLEGNLTSRCHSEEDFRLAATFLVWNLTTFKKAMIIEYLQ